MADPQREQAQAEADVRRQEREQCELEVDLGIRCGLKRVHPPKAQVQAVAYCALLEDLPREQYQVEANYPIRAIAHGRRRAALASIAVLERATRTLWCTAVVTRARHHGGNRRVRLLWALTGRPVARIRGLDEARQAARIMAAAVRQHQAGGDRGERGVGGARGDEGVRTVFRSPSA